MEYTNIVITAATISGNKGAEGMLQSTIQNISEVLKNPIFNLLSYYPKEDILLNDTKNLKILDGRPFYLLIILAPLALIYFFLKKLEIPTAIIEKNKDLDALIKSELFIDLSGLSFVDGRTKYLPFNILNILIPLLLGKKIVKFSQALGPFNNELNKTCAKFFLPKLDLIVARGRITKAHLNSLGLTNVIIGADVAFSLNVGHEHLIIAEKLIKFNNSKKLIGIAPSSVIEEFCEKKNIDYSQIMADFINLLISKKDFNIVIVPHSIRKNSKKRKNNDLIISEKIFRKVENHERCLLISDELDSRELRCIIGKCDYFIASRFHSMISSLAMEVPTLVCGWSHKYLEVLEMFDMEEYCMDYDELRHDVLLDKIDLIIKNQKEIQSKFEYYLPKVIECSKKPNEIVRNLLIP